MDSGHIQVCHRADAAEMFDIGIVMLVEVCDKYIPVQNQSPVRNIA
jgi:hypothetical protein